MATCVGNTCGVPGAGPLPGDPTGNSALSATPAFGGIDVTWSLPETNPFAVAYTMLYRGNSDSFASALKIADVSGGFFYDKRDSANRYYYWIRHVSINGTIGELIGPASAVARPPIADVIEGLTGLIDDGLLATVLRNKIGRIEIIESDLLQEVTDRETGETTLSEAMQDVQAGLADQHTFVLEERATRISQNSALAEQITGVAATWNDSLALAVSDLTASITSVGGQVTALAEEVDQIVVTVGEDIAGVQTTLTAQIAEVGDQVTGLASELTTVQTAIGEDIAAVQTYAETQVNSITNRIDALWVVNLTVNDLVGGFGLANNGETVEAGFDVDRFWVGRTNANKRKPFIIDDDVVYIDDAVIRQLVFSKLRDESGALIVEDGKIKATYLEAVTVNADNITAGSLRGINVNAGSFTTRGSYLTTACAAGAAVLNVKNTTDFPSSGSGWIMDSATAVTMEGLGNDRDVIQWTGKTSTTLTGVTGALAHLAGATIIPSGQAMAIDSNTNQMRYYGDRGDGVYDELASIGQPSAAYFNAILTVGNGTGAGYNRTAILARANNTSAIRAANQSSASPTMQMSNSVGPVILATGDGSGLGTIAATSLGSAAAIEGIAQGNGNGGYFQGNATRAPIRLQSSSSGWPTNRSPGQITFGMKLFYYDGTLLGSVLCPAYTDDQGYWRWFSDDSVAA